MNSEEIAPKCEHCGKIGIIYPEVDDMPVHISDADFKFCGHRFSASQPSVREVAPTGADLIQQERQRQIESEGWTPEHDDHHSMGEMALAAKTYILLAQDIICGRARAIYPGWPWDYSWWKPSPDPIRNLVKAGALIAAEIDRLQRKEASNVGPK